MPRKSAIQIARELSSPFYPFIDEVKRSGWEDADELVKRLETVYSPEWPDNTEDAAWSVKTAYAVLNRPAELRMKALSISALIFVFQQHID
jgi:hypothetical protein